MARLSFLLVPILAVAASAFSLPTTTTATPRSTNFIVTSCNATTYPKLCLDILSNFSSEIHQSPRQLTKTALAVSLSGARSAKRYVLKLVKYKGLKPREYAALQDCMEEMDDSIDELRQSIEEMTTIGRSKGKDIEWHMSNVETWVSAALTDDDTCVDGFGGKNMDGKIKALIKARCLRIAQITSNALALVNRYASRASGH